MTQIELLKAATPGLWKWETELHEDPFPAHWQAESEADAELLRQAKANALLVECAKQGWDIRELGGNSGVRFESDDCQHESSWPGTLQDMPEDVFNAVLAELEGAK